MTLAITVLITVMSMLSRGWSYKERYIRSNETVIFRCNGQEESTSWFRGTEILKSGKNIIVKDKRFTFQDDGEQLVALSGTVASDSNIYTCRLNTGDGRILTEYKLSVMEPPAIRVGSGNFSGPILEADETSNVSLWCNVTGDPPPNVTWYTYLKSNRSKEIGIYGPKLHISNISRYCPWRYYCEMEFIQYENMKLKKGMNISINYPPDIALGISKLRSKETTWSHLVLNETENRFPANITDRISMRCLVDARPYNSSTWLFNGKPFLTHNSGEDVKTVDRPPFYYDITESNHAVEGRWKVLLVVFKILTKEAYGLYECQARNSFGNQSASIFIYQ
ncbi:limbic system-associated membrane protein-like [Argopecten irradians]|uniref:limbic system-associated membrane protein-like n=1 Tax=Argopecten irradians TaxID=31199 RepID=UPI003721FD57